MLNQCQFIGHLGADPEIRTFGNGGRVCNLRLACSEKWKDKTTGERKERTEWITIAIFTEGLINVCEQYIKKGSKVFVQGKFTTRKWQDQSGNNRYSSEISLQGFGGVLTMLDSTQGGSGGGQSSDSQGGGSIGGGYVPPANNDMDDEIPF